MFVNLFMFQDCQFLPKNNHQLILNKAFKVLPESKGFFNNLRKFEKDCSHNLFYYTEIDLSLYVIFDFCYFLPKKCKLSEFLKKRV